jgi:tryptophanyl-tRNA synthetase
MAADILLYQTDLVPVGDDQQQHVELTRDVAHRFNTVYGEVFKMPEPYIPKGGARIMSLQEPENKMSKSEQDNGGCICLLDKPEAIMKAFKRAVTDSETEVRYDEVNKKGISNLMNIYATAPEKALPKLKMSFPARATGTLRLR